MRIAPVADVKARFAAYLRECKEGPVVVTRNGKPAAVLLAVDDEEELERLVLAYSAKFRSILDAAKEHIQDTGGIKHEDLWQQAEEQEGSRP